MKIQKLENRKKFDDEKGNNIFEFFCITQQNQVIKNNVVKNEERKKE
jgi:hypothetical protein